MQEEPIRVQDRKNLSYPKPSRPKRPDPVETLHFFFLSEIQIPAEKGKIPERKTKRKCHHQPPRAART